MKRILFVTSKPQSWFESQDSAEHFKNAPYSIDAIGYNLVKRGWAVGWMGRRSATSPISVMRRIDSFKPDIVYTYGSTVALHPIFMRKFCHHRAYKVVHGWDDEYGVIYRSVFGRVSGKLMDIIEKLIVTKSDGVVTLSRHLERKGAQWGVKCEYIPNGADEIDRVRIGGAIHLEGDFKLVYTGDKAKWKHTVDICRAMKDLPDNVKLYMTGTEYDYLRPYYSANCISLGYLTKAEQLNVMSQADAFVVTADQDCNAKLQEYLRWHKPILANDGQARNFFTDERNALLAKDGEFAPLVKRLINEPELGQALADNAAHDIRVYTWAEIAALFERYFESITTL